MVMREVLMLIGAGVAAGIPLALILSRLVRSQLFGLEPHDPFTFVSSMSVLTVVACRIDSGFEGKPDRSHGCAQM
jgi:hypothetical protein